MMKHLLTVSIAAASVLSINAATAGPLMRADGRSHTLSTRELTGKTAGVVRNNLMKAPQRLTRAAATELFWGYCADPYACFPIYGDMKVAFMMPADAVASFAGNKISGIEFANPVDVDNADDQSGIYPCQVKEATVWISKDLKGEPICSGTGEITSGGFEWTKIDLSTPYDIKEGEELYIGVSFTVPTGNFGFVTDYGYPDNEDSAWLYSTYKGLSEDGQINLGGKPGWKKVGEAFGNVCVRAVITGDNLPQYVLDVEESEIPMAVIPGEKFPVLMGITNKGAQEIESVELTFEAEGQEVQTVTSDVMIGYDEDRNPVMGALPYNQYGIIQGEFSCSLKANNIPYKVYVSKINGNAPEGGDAQVNGYLLSLDSGYAKNNVIEEATGLWCQACVIGYAGMEYIKENIPGLIGVAMHFNDLMDVFGDGKCYNPFFTKVDAYPSGFVNRNWSRNVYPAPEELQAEYDQIAEIPAMAKISGTVTNVSDDGKKIKLSTSTEFSLAEPEASYGVAYLVVEDELGPYPQTNGFAGYEGDAYGFQDLPNPAMLIFNDVIRNCSKPLAVESSIVKGTETGKAYTFETEIELTDVLNVNKYRVVALVLNGLTGAIENACVVPSPTYSGVEEIVSASQHEAIAFGGKGVLTLRATGLDASVFTVDGACVASGLKSGEISLAPGLYIVSNGRESSKVVVK